MNWLVQTKEQRTLPLALKNLFSYQTHLETDFGKENTSWTITQKNRSFFFNICKQILDRSISSMQLQTYKSHQAMLLIFG